MTWSPLGTWKMVGSTETNYVKINFTDEDYTGSTSMENPKKGEIIDSIDGVVDTFKFYYTFKNGKLSASIYSVNITSSTDFSSDPYDYVIDFYYEASTDKYGLVLAECTYDSYYEDYACYSIYGEVTLDGEIVSYLAFEREE